MIIILLIIIILLLIIIIIIMIITMKLIMNYFHNAHNTLQGICLNMRCEKREVRMRHSTGS